MKKTISVLSAVLGMSAFAAIPVITGVTPENVGGKIRVSYKLAGAPAIVTAEFFTNGAPIAAEWAREGLSGDVGKAVQIGSRCLVWKASKTYPGREFPGANLTVRLTAWSLQSPPDYMAVPLTEGAAGLEQNRYYASAEMVPGGVTNRLYKTDVLLMRHIRAAGRTWRMGTPKTETGRVTGEMLPHYVTMTNDYYMGIYELTKQQARAVVPNPSSKLSIIGSSPATDDDVCPASSVTLDKLRSREVAYRWPEMGHLVEKGTFLDTMRGRTGLEFDFPTEAQWEYACRAGTTTAYYNGANVTNEEAIADIAWTDGNCDGMLHEVGLKAPNAFGLYDMCGNVCEICLDVYPETKTAYPASAMMDIYQGRDAIEPVGLCQADADAVGYALEYAGGNGRHARRGGFCLPDYAVSADHPNNALSTYMRSGARLPLSPTAGYQAVGYRPTCPAAYPNN